MSELVPIYEPNMPWKAWNIKEIYDGTVTGGRYCPKVDDAVWDWDQGLFRVIAVDESTSFCTLAKYVAPASNDTVTELDVLSGVGPGYPSESYRLYVDSSVTPATACVDSRIHLYSSTATKIKIFSGTDISIHGKVISRHYDNSGMLLGDTIPLEVIANASNRSIKAPVVGSVNTILADGEMVTVVVYDDAGGVRSTCRLLVQNSAFLKAVEDGSKHVMGIALVSPFIKDSDPYTIEFPINLPIEDMPLTGEVLFSDGSRKKMTVDGNRMALLGKDCYVATINGQRQKMTLTYYLDDNEAVYGASVGESRHLPMTYWAKTVEVNNAYSVKLFVFPCWNEVTSGYDLEYWLYNLDRDMAYEVTSYVEIGSTSGPFNPRLYGVTQQITVAIDLNKVDGRLAAYRHVQNVFITLYNPGSWEVEKTLWTAHQTIDQDPPFGLENVAKIYSSRVGDYRVKVDSGAATLEQWLRRMYYDTQPLVIQGVEAKAPTPSHFIVYANGLEREVAIADWDKEIPIGTGLTRGQTLFIKFISRTEDDDLQLAIAGLPVDHIGWE